MILLFNDNKTPQFNDVVVIDKKQKVMIVFV